MIARVLWKRDRPEPAMILSSLAAFVLALIAIDDLAKIRVLPIPAETPAYALVTTCFLVLAIAPWLTPSRRARPAKVAIADGSVRIDERVILANHVTAFSIARAVRGLSIAIERGNEVVFVEVDRDEDAARIARALHRDPAKPNVVTPRGASRILALIQANATLLLLVLAPLYWLGAESTINVGKEIGGIGGLFASFAAMAIFLLRRVVKTRDAKGLGRGAYAAHAALHRANLAPALAVKEAASPLMRGEEPVKAWLDRLDKLPANEGAYRALPRDVLHEVLSNEGAALDERMAAARMLRRRYGEPASIVRVVTDPDVRIRVEAAADGDVEEAEEKIERLGPVFRAR